MRGLYGLANIYERVAQDNGYGAVEDRLVLVAENVRCRFTRLNAEESTKMFGKGGVHNWRVSTSYVAGLSRNKLYAIRRAKES